MFPDVSIDRRRLLFLSLAVADSAWLFAVASVVGVIVGLGESPLPWLVMLSVLALAMGVAWVAGGVGGDFVTLALLQGGIGLTAVYGSVALRMTEASGGFDGFWFGRLLTGDFSQTEIVTVLSGLGIGIYLWQRGIRFVVAGEPWETLHRSFRWGIAAIAIALIAELATDENVGATLVIFPFFAASLAGMSVGRLAEEGAWGSAQKIWGRVIAGTVAGVLAVGVALGAAGAAFGGGPLGLLIAVAAAIRDAFIKVLEVVLTPPIAGLFWLIDWLRNRFGTDDAGIELLEGEPQQEEQLEQTAERAADAVGDSLAQNIIEILVWPVGIMVLLLILWVLIKSFRRMRKRYQREADTDRESIRGDADARRDLADLLGRLIPGFLRGGEGAQQGLRYPANEPGITEVFQLYFRYLSAGLRRGAVLQSHLTPAELTGTLQAALPGAPVGLATRRFEAACYGHEPTDAVTLREIEAGLAAAEREEGEGAG